MKALTSPTPQHPDGIQEKQEEGSVGNASPFQGFRLLFQKYLSACCLWMQISLDLTDEPGR